MSRLRVDELESIATGTVVPVSSIDTEIRRDLADPDKGAAMVSYGDSSAADRLNELSDDNFSRIASLSRSGKLRLAIVGDSTAAGVGAGGGVYGECNQDSRAGYSMVWYWSLINSDPAFVGVSETSLYYRRSSTIDVASLASAFPCYNFVYADNPSTDNQELVYPRGTAATDRLTIYYNERTSNGAALFDVVVSDATTGAEISRHTIDSYVDPVDFGSAGTFNVLPRLTKTTVTLPALVSKVMVRVENVSLADRGTGTPTNGSVNVYGFALGDGVMVRNFAVSSTTLLNNSAANITRGVTTSERLQKCYDMNANAIVINWGSNDSKPGISTVDEFKSSLSSRIDEIRDFNPGMSIVLATTAAGSAGSEYENNVIFFEAIREVASKKLCGLLDGQRIIRQLPRADVVADDVHPNERGYQIIADALGAKSGSRSLRPKGLSLSPAFKKAGYATKSGVPNISDFSGDWILLEDVPIGRAPIPCQLVVHTMLNLFRAGAEIDGCELAVSFGATTGGSFASTPTVSISVPRVPGDTGDARGVIVDERVLYSANGFMSGPYYIKIWAKNFGLRPSEGTLRVLWRYEEL